MSDQELSQLERAWQESPGDRALLERLIVGRRRAGHSVSWRLLRGVVTPGRALTRAAWSSRWWITPQGRVVKGDVYNFDSLEPEHVLWGVSSSEAGEPAQKAIDEVRAAQIPGLALERATDAELAQVAELSHLRALRIGGGGISDAGLAFLGKLHKLEALVIELGVPTPSFEGTGFAALGRLPDLTALWLTSRSNDQTLKPSLLGNVARSLERLTSLSISNLRFEQTGEALRILPRLECFHMDANRQLTDADLGLVSPRLRELRLETCFSVTAAGFRALGLVAGLESLEIRGCPGLSRAPADELRRRLPQCRLELEERPGDLRANTSPGASCPVCRGRLRDVAGQTPAGPSGHPAGGDYEWCEVTESVSMECAGCGASFTTRRTSRY